MFADFLILGLLMGPPQDVIPQPFQTLATDICNATDSAPLPPVDISKMAFVNKELTAYDDEGQVVENGCWIRGAQGSGSMTRIDIRHGMPILSLSWQDPKTSCWWIVDCKHEANGLWISVSYHTFYKSYEFSSYEDAYNRFPFFRRIFDDKFLDEYGQEDFINERINSKVEDSGWTPEPSLVDTITSLLPKIDDNNYRVRRSTIAAIIGLGENGVVYLMKIRNREHLSVQQQVTIDYLISRYVIER